MIKTAWRKFQNNQFNRFLFVGALNTAVGYLVFSLLIFFNFHYFLALTFSSIVGTMHSYVWNKYYTFKHYEKCIKEMLRFISVYVVIYILNLFLLYIFVDIFAFNPIIVQAIVIVCVTICSFLGHKFWSFR